MSEVKRTYHIDNLQRKGEIEKELGELKTKYSKVKGIVLKIGGVEFLFDGSFGEFGEFLQNSNLKKLKEIKHTDGDWYSWEDKYKDLTKDLSFNPDFTEEFEGFEEDFDIQIKTNNIYTRQDAERIEQLQKEYKDLVIEDENPESEKVDVDETPTDIPF